MDFFKDFCFSFNPSISAIILGIITVLSPCQIPANLASCALIINDKRQIRTLIYKILAYSFGRTFVYATLAIPLIYAIRNGFDIAPVSSFVSKYGELLLAVFLFVFGVLIFITTFFHDKIHHNCHSHNHLHYKLFGSGICAAFSMGFAFAIAFCPSNAFFFFGILVPIASINCYGIFFPFLYALGTILPILLCVFMASLGVDIIDKINVSFFKFERIFSCGIAFIFIASACFMFFEYFND